MEPRSSHSLDKMSLKLESSQRLFLNVCCTHEAKFIGASSKFDHLVI